MEAVTAIASRRRGDVAEINYIEGFDSNCRHLVRIGADSQGRSSVSVGVRWRYRSKATLGIVGGCARNELPELVAARLE